MNTNRKTTEDLGAAKANIIRAFYDAVENLLEERSKDGYGSKKASLAQQRFEAVIARSQDLGEEEFTTSLRFAANTYFSQTASNLPDD